MRAGSLPGYDQVPPATSWTPSGQSTSSDLTIRPPMSPWDAAAQYGHVEPAFQHLNPPRSFTSTVSVSSAASAPPFIPAGGQPQSTPARQPHQHAQHSTTTSMHISRLTSPPANGRQRWSYNYSAFSQDTLKARTERRNWTELNWHGLVFDE